MNNLKRRHTQPISGGATHSTAVHGFTLIELMVVIAIIAILVSLIFYALKGTKNSANEFKLLNVIRNVAQANITYAGENNGQINILRDPSDPLDGSPGWVSDTFWGRLQPYLFKNVQATSQADLAAQIRTQLSIQFNCSGIDSKPVTWKGTPFFDIKVYGDVSGLPVPFGFNKYLVKYNGWVTRQQISNPGTTAYFTYGWYHFDEDDAKTYAPMPKLGGAKVTNNIYYMTSKKAIVAFLDGHVAYMVTPIAPETVKFDGAGQ